MGSAANKSILITVDVEDWFQVENFKAYIPFSSWSDYRLRVETSTQAILHLLDTFPFSPRATFFFLGWVARRLPRLVREVHDRGHEVASHGMDHHLPATQKPETFLSELMQSRALLADLTGSPVYGYRAPSFAVNDDILALIRQAGFLYDSSYNSFSMHGRYGTIDLPETGKKQTAVHISDRFYELPVSNLTIGSRVLPLGGGGYFRLIPLPVFIQGMKQVFTRQDAFLFYTHPWEFDPDQPRVRQAAAGFKFRHYINLHKTKDKLAGMIQSFRDCRFPTCYQYVNETVFSPETISYR